MYDGGGGGGAMVTSKNSTIPHYIMADPFPSFISRFPLQLFINQGGFIDGLKQMCLVSDRETGHTSFQSGPVNQEFEKHCNVKYTQRDSNYCNTPGSYSGGCE